MSRSIRQLSPRVLCSQTPDVIRTKYIPLIYQGIISSSLILFRLPKSKNASYDQKYLNEKHIHTASYKTDCSDGIPYSSLQRSKNPFGISLGCAHSPCQRRRFGGLLPDLGSGARELSNSLFFLPSKSLSVRVWFSCCLLRTLSLVSMPRIVSFSEAVL